MLKCYRLLFSSKIIKNIGCIIVSSIILVKIISMIIFYSYGYNVFSKKIKNIVEAKLTKINENNINIYNKKENKIKKSNIYLKILKNLKVNLKLIEIVLKMKKEKNQRKKIKIKNR